MRLPVPESVALPLVWLAVAALLLYLHRHVARWAKRRAAAGAPPLEEGAVQSLARLYLPALLLAGGYAAIEIIPLHGRWQAYAERGLHALAALFAVWAVWRAFGLLLHYWADTNPNAQTLVPPLQWFGRVFGAVLGVALVLSALGFSLTKVWAALGIGSVAIALALQDTLANSFAGLHIMLDQPFRLGDHIKMDSGEEGRVIQIGWRSTRLHTALNSILVIPNAKLSRASITNLSLPQPRLVLTISVPVSYRANPRAVKKLLEEVAAGSVREVEGVLSEPPPAVRFHAMGDNALHFHVVLQVRDAAAQAAVQDEVRCRIVERLQSAGIEMASPAPAAPPS